MESIIAGLGGLAGISVVLSVGIFICMIIARGFSWIYFILELGFLVLKAVISRRNVREDLLIQTCWKHLKNSLTGRAGMTRFSLLLCISVIFAALMGLGFYNHTQRVPRFYREAHKMLKTVSFKTQTPSVPAVYQLPSGEAFAVVLEHSCCSGKGFDAVMIKDSEGNYYTAEKNYCGYEGFGVAEGEIKSLQDLKSYLQKNGYKRL